MYFLVSKTLVLILLVFSGRYCELKNFLNTCRTVRENITFSQAVSILTR